MIIDTNILNFMSRLHVGEHAGFGEEFVENAKADAANLPAAKPLWDKYEAAVSQEVAMYKQSPESPETKEIAEFDKFRDTHWGEIVHRLKFSEKSPDENVRKAAAKLLFIVKPFTDAPASNLFEETVAMHKVLLKLKETENNAATALINGFDALVLETEALNDNLHGLYKDKEKLKELGTLAQKSLNTSKTVADLFG